jgi:hypothetical protein
MNPPYLIYISHDLEEFSISWCFTLRTSGTKTALLKSRKPQAPFEELAALSGAQASSRRKLELFNLFLVHPV